MKAFDVVVMTPVGHGLRLLALAVLFAGAAVCVAAFRQRRSTPFQIFCAAQPVVGMVWMSFLLDGTFQMLYLETPRAYPQPVRWVYGLPWAAVLFVTLGLCVPIVCAVWSLISYRRKRLLPGAEKNAMDFLPAGICFRQADGTVLLSNLQMREWVRQITGHNLEHSRQLWKTLCELGEPYAGGGVLLHSGEKALLCTQDKLTIEQKEYTQFCAYDITEQNRVTDELKALKAKLQDIQTRMKQYSAQLSAHVQEKENLNARILVHDEIGQTLLAQKYYFDHPENTDEAHLLQVLRYTNQFFLRDTQQPETADPIESALSRAETIGVRVDVHGDFPQDAAARAVFGRAIGECAANTAKHAGSNTLSVTAECTPSGTTVLLTSAGAVRAQSPVTERGGLLSLRRLVEQHGGQMCVTADRAFCVQIFLPNKPSHNRG